MEKCERFTLLTKFLCVFFSAVLNLSYIDFSSRISLSVIGPLRESSSSTGEYIWINVRNQDQMNNSESKVFKYDRSSDEVRTLAFDFYPEVSSNTLNLTLTMKTNITNSVDFKVFVDANSIMPAIGVISAVFILIFLNVLFGAEVKSLKFAKLYHEVDLRSSIRIKLNFKHFFSLDSSPNSCGNFHNIYVNWDFGCST